MRVTGINFNTTPFKGAYIVKGNFKETDKFRRVLESHKDDVDCKSVFIGLRVSPKQPRYDFLVVTEDDIEKYDEYSKKRSERRMSYARPNPDRMEWLRENPNTKEFLDYYMLDFGRETSELQKALGKKIPVMSAQQVISAAKVGRFNFITGKIKK